MADTLTDIRGWAVAIYGPDGPTISGEADALDIIGSAGWQHADLVVIPAKRFDDGFFTLSTKVAGDIIQKFVNYRLPLVIVGDISAHLAASSALRAFVSESNTGRHAWFLADLGELEARLTQRS
jgi:hypothetical protein